jgi:hypothetical protein
MQGTRGSRETCGEKRRVAQEVECVRERRLPLYHEKAERGEECSGEVDPAVERSPEKQARCSARFHVCVRWIHTSSRENGGVVLVMRLKEHVQRKQKPDQHEAEHPCRSILNTGGRPARAPEGRPPIDRAHEDFFGERIVSSARCFSLGGQGNGEAFARRRRERAGSAVGNR